jgi:hypothetical protein
MMRAPLSTVLLGAALAILTAAACGYNPNPESGTLQCGPDNTCPQNYTCRSGLCWRDGAGGSTGTGGTGGGDPPSHFIGVWVSDPSLAKRVRVCNDGTNETLAWDDYLDITAGGPALLRTNYYCDWDLDLNVGGTATVIRPGAMCTKPDMNDPSIMFTWHGESLTLTTTNGTSGTLDMSLPYEYTTTTGSGSCTLHFTGPMTKS